MLWCILLLGGIIQEMSRIRRAAASVTGRNTSIAVWLLGSTTTSSKTSNGSFRPQSSTTGWFSHYTGRRLFGACGWLRLCHHHGHLHSPRRLCGMVGGEERAGPSNVDLYKCILSTFIELGLHLITRLNDGQTFSEKEQAVTMTMLYSIRVF